MDLKKFESLPDPDKIKILKICELISLKQLDGEIESIPPKPVGQKTLDGWLLKSKGTSGVNSKNSLNKSDEKRISTENAGSQNATEKNSQDVVKCSDSKTSESRRDKTLKHDFVKSVETHISNDVATGSESILTPASSAELRSETEKNLTELERHNLFINNIVKNNPIVLIEKLNLTDVPGVDFDTSSTSLADRTSHLNEESSLQTILPSTVCNKPSIDTSSNDGVSTAAKNVPLEIDNLESSPSSNKHQEAYNKLKKLCSNQGLDLDYIFRTQEFKEIIEKHKSLPGAIFFIGSHKCETTGKVKPVVSFHKSKEELKTIIKSKKQK